VTAIGWEHQPERGSGGVDLAVLGTVWLLALVALSQPAWTWILAALAVFTIHAVLVIRSAGAGAASLAQLEAAGYILATILTAFTALRPTLAMHIRISARRAALASRLTAERAAADAVRAERRRGLARLEHEALPLLRGIAEGRLDPADAGVRERCGRHVAALRDSLTGPAPAAVGLMSVLGPALRAARARRVMVNVQVIGDPGVPPPDVAREIGATVEAALGALPPHQVMLTVLAVGEEAELYLTSSEPELDCVQLSWRSSASSSSASPSGASSNRGPV
jgi:hypothetical protein